MRKKIITLTESELVDLVEKIIKEQESTSSQLPFRIKKTVQDIINTKRFNELQEGMMVSVKNNKVTILPGGSESSEEYVVDLTPKTFPDTMEQQTKMKVVKGKLAIKFMNGKVLLLEPSMKVLVFKP